MRWIKELLISDSVSKRLLFLLLLDYWSVAELADLADSEGGCLGGSFWVLLLGVVEVLFGVVEGEVELSCVLVGIGPGRLFLFGLPRLLGIFPWV